jgi:beta-glucosidase
MEKLSNTHVVKADTLLDYKNSSLPIDDRVADLLKRMTLAEKVAQMLCIWQQKEASLFDGEGKLNLEKIRPLLKDGMGQIARLSDRNNGLTALEMVKYTNVIQKFFREETRLGIPVIFHEECLHGLVARETTSYPQPIGLAATFNPALIEDIYSAIAEDTRARGAHQALTPVLDVAREPRWGRVEETFGEDPYLIARLGIAAVRGFQGDGSFKNKNKVIATLKHFAAHGQPESGTNCGPANFSERLLRDIFLFPFKEAVTKGKAYSVMASYNEIDGVPSHANKWLLRDLLRGEWGFEGFVVSDYFAITELNIREEATSHRVASDKSEAAFLAANSGVNIELPDRDCYTQLVQLVESGLLNESVIDDLVSSLLKYKFMLGLFDDPYVDPKQIQTETRLQKDRNIARRAAREVITLLKNEDEILPLHLKKGSTLAIIGPNADRILLGGYSGQPKYYTTVLQGIKERLDNKINILHSEGCKITVGGSWNEDAVVLPDPEDDRKSIEQAVKIAAKADTVVLALGGNEQTSREAWSRYHLGDRNSTELLGMQNNLARAIIATGKPVIVLLFNGRPNSINFLQKNAHAILECWYLGQETGHAVADVLFGDYNPCGKLPISIPRSVGHIPCYYNHKPSDRRGYLFDDHTPIYPFGYGLSFTSFEFSNLRLEKPIISSAESTQVLIDVKNTGKIPGEEIVQMYIRDLVSSVTRPVKELKGFKKICLDPGETITVAFTISFEHLAFTNINMEYTVEPGDFEIMVGNSSRAQDLSTVTLHVTCEDNIIKKRLG